MNSWTKVKDMNFSNIEKYDCCDYVMVNSSNQFYCQKYDILIEHGGMEADAVAMFCANYRKYDHCCWTKMRCGAILFKEKNEIFKDIIKLQDEFIVKNPKDPNGYKQRASSYGAIFTKMNNYRFSFNPNWVKVLVEHYDKEIKDHAEIAINDYSTAIKLNSGDAETFAMRGALYSQIKNDINALADFEKAIEIDSKCKVAYQFRGSMYSDRKEYEKAIVDLEYALKLSPDCEITSLVLKNAKKFKAEEDIKNQNNAVAQFNEQKYQSTRVVTPPSLVTNSSASQLTIDKAAQVLAGIGKPVEITTSADSSIDFDVKAPTSITTKPARKPASKSKVLPVVFGVVILALVIAGIIYGLDTAKTRAAEKAAAQAIEHKNRGITFANQNSYKQAVKEFTDAIELKPSAALYELRGRALITSMAATVTLPKSDFSEAMIAPPLGEMTRDQHRILELAIADFTSAIQLDPENAVLYRERGRAYDWRSWHSQALVDFNTALRLNPNYTMVYNSRGNLYVNTGDLDKAIADFSRAIQLDPNFFSAYRNRGRAYERMEELDMAIADFEMVLRINPTHDQTKRDIERLRRQQQRQERENRNTVIAHIRRGRGYLTRGDNTNNATYYDRALIEFNQAILLDPNNAEAYFGRGRSYLRKGDNPRAIEAYNQAVRLNPNDAISYSNRGRAYARMGNFDQAVADFEIAHRIDPSNELIRENLERALRREEGL